MTNDAPDIMRKPLVIFFVLLILFSTACYFPIVTAHSIKASHGFYTSMLMWAPGAAALLTQLICYKSLFGLGWKPGNIRYWLLAFCVPLAYATLVYVIVWITGLGGVPNPEFVSMLKRKYPDASFYQATALFIFTQMTSGVASNTWRALGEELGWRGFLVPQLAKLTSFSKTSLIVGGVWAVWHFPAILLTDYNIGVPAWCAIPCFTVCVLGISFVMAWLRLKSRSVWPCAILHTVHNMLIQAILTPLTIDKGTTNYFIDEFGLFTAIAIAATAFLFWRKRSSLE